MEKKFFIFLISLITLSSCDFRFTFGVDSQLSLPENDTNNFYLAEEVKYSLQELNSQIGWVTSESTGEQKLLIIPVMLSDYASSSNSDGDNKYQYKYNDSKIDNLETAFFGDSDETAFYSVTDYFYQSSYGNLVLRGEVIDVFESRYTSTELGNYGDRCADYIIDEWYKQADINLLKDYDVNQDGLVDNAVFIYSNPYNQRPMSNGSTPFWAWCSSTGILPNRIKPAINNYMWASYEFLNKMYADYYNNSKIETHTYIHETGHLLGVDDYYCYDSSNNWNAAGILDMQAYNVGDHNAYSKLALGWIKPYVVTGNSRIKLKTSALYGEAILINNFWNGSAFDEYLLIEYYTPQGLNEIDSRHFYEYNRKMYDYSGLRIYHVDARMVKTTATNGYLDYSSNYVDIISSEENYYTVIGASNSVERSYLKNHSAEFRLLHLLDQGENNRLKDGKGGYVSASTALWTGEKIFTPSSKFFSNGRGFNDGRKIGYSISVSSLNDVDCVVTIAKI